MVGRISTRWWVPGHRAGRPLAPGHRKRRSHLTARERTAEYSPAWTRGLLDVVLHPDFANNRWVYFSFAESGERGFGTAVARGQLADNQLANVETIFRMQPKSTEGRHFGSRLVFDRDGYLFITLGDRGERGARKHSMITPDR